MKSIFFRSLVIALVLGILMAFLMSLLSASYQVTSDIVGEGRVLVGVEAIQSSINAFGIWGYAKGLIAPGFLFFIGIFLGCLWLALWMNYFDS